MSPEAQSPLGVLSLLQAELPTSGSSALLDPVNTAPGERRSLVTVSPAQACLRHQETLSTKCQIVVNFCIKKQNFKKVVTCHSNKTGIHYTQETRTQANIKIHIVQGQQG